MYQKICPVPLYCVLTAQSLGAVQHFGEQAEIDEIAIQTAPCGNGRQVLWCIHGFFKLAVCVPIIECSGIRRHQQWVEMNILLNVYNITAVLCG